MTLALSLLCIILVAVLCASFHKASVLTKALASANPELNRLSEELDEARKLLDSATQKLAAESNKLLTTNAELDAVRHEYTAAQQRFLAEANELSSRSQQLVDQHFSECKQAIEQIRQHYENEAEKIYVESQAEISRLESLRKYQALQLEEEEARHALSTAITEASSLRAEAQALLDHTRLAAAEQQKAALEKVRDIGRQSEALLAQTRRDAAKILAAANKRAEEIGGDAYVALREKQFLEEALQAIHNVVEGYGDKYVIPTHSVLDDLAQSYSHTAAGESLRLARENSRRMIVQGEAAACDYAETSRRETAIRFVIDAFNGRVDAILTRAKNENIGTLEQEIRDAFSLVNLNGEAFRNARIFADYLDSRLAELKYAVVVHELRQRDREEQRRIQDQIREEEKARRDFERAMKEAAREEETLRKAIEKAELQVRGATIEQKERYERELQELAEKLKTAEEKNQRAISMAQQTRRGHVYIVSNIGSFGEHIYKIGLTRRLEPLDRIRELGDSSVPFEFDVHAMIFSEDAPALELQLHNHFLLSQVNKVNHRKEFFRVDLKYIREELEKLGISASWTMAASAADYRETMAIEKMIKDNPNLREAWIQRQLELEVVEPLHSAAEPSAHAVQLESDRRNVGLPTSPLESF